MTQTVPNHRQVRYPAIVSSWAGAGSRNVSCRARSSICCAKTALAAGLSPAICANPTALISPPAATTSAIVRRPVRCERRASRSRVNYLDPPALTGTRSARPVRSSLRGGCGRRSPPHSLVEPEEDLLERWLAAFEFRDSGAREHREQRLEVTAEHAGKAVIFDSELIESGYPANTLDRRRSGEHDLDTMRAHAGELIELANGREMPFAHDPDPIADMLDLGEYVRRDEDRRAAA